MIYIKNDRSVFPNNVKVSNQYENETRTIQFDLSDVQFTGNTYLICKYQNNQDFYAPLLLDSNFSIPVETFLSAQAGTYSCVIAISTATIGPDYDFSTDNPLFVSNIFTLTVDANFLTGTSTSWQLTPAAQNYFDQLIALVEKVKEDLDSGAFVGNGISEIKKTGSEGLVDTYQIIFTNDQTFEYQVTNGATPVITIQDGYWYINGVNTGQQAQGDKGEPGDNATINVGEVTTLEPGQEATVTNTGSETNALLAFGIPKGEKGDKGDKGETGDNATIAIGTVTTLEPDQEATVQNTGTDTNAVLSFGIPKGVQGATGPQGPQGAPGVNENVLHADISKSENPSVDDAYEASLRELKLYGKSTQVHTTGKNLFDADSITKVVNNYAFDISKLVIGETYTISCDADSFSFKISNTISGHTSVGANNVTTGKSTFTMARHENIPEGTTQYLFITKSSLVTANDITTADEAKALHIQIEKGSTATAYEPYTGGQPSPNPDYPQEITKIEEVDCLVTGANLFDISTSEDGSIKDGQETATQGYKRSNYIPVTPGGTIARTPQDITGIAGNFFYDIDKNFLTNISSSSSSSSSSAIAVPENAYYYRFVFNNTLTELMVNVGETLLPYEPYQSQHVQFTPPAPLYSLLDGSVADYVDVARGKYVYELADVTFDGSKDEVWTTYPSASTLNGVSISVNDMVSDDRGSGLCDRFHVKDNRLGNNMPNDIWLGVSNNVMYFPTVCNDIDGVTDVTSWRSWLQSNNVFVVYQLATPTEQDIPAETLEALQALKTFNGVTNIFCNAPVSAQYEQSVQIVMNKILEQINKLQTQTLNLQEEMINNV